MQDEGRDGLRGEAQDGVRDGGARTALVVGAGITGVAAAIRLRRMGWRTTLVDRAPPGDRGAASFGNGGILARCSIVPVPVPGLLAKAPRMLFDPDQPLYLRWSYLPRMAPFLARYLSYGREGHVRRIAAALAGLTGDRVDEHRALAAGTGAERFIETGDYGHIFRSRAEYEKDALGNALRAQHGFVPYEVDRAGLLERDPALGEAWTFGAIYPDHGWIRNPGAYVAALAEAFVREGGVIRRAEVEALDGEGRATLAGGAAMRADRVVLAAGAWSAKLAAGLGLRLPMESERGYHLALKAPSSRPAHPWMVSEVKAVATPMDFGIRMAGIVEFGGLEAGPSAAPPRLLRAAAARIWPGLEWEAEEEWMGHRPVLADSLPAIGPIPGAPAVVAAFGGQHVGLTAGPRIGRLAAEIAAGQALNEDLSACDPGRFR